jgi:ankyrin repeat protein
MFKKKIEGQLETVQFLLNKGANVNATDRFSNTPVQDALRFHFFILNFFLRAGHNEIVKLLKSRGGVSELPLLKQLNSLMSAIQNGSFHFF